MNALDVTVTFAIWGLWLSAMATCFDGGFTAWPVDRGAECRREAGL